MRARDAEATGPAAPVTRARMGLVVGAERTALAAGLGCYLVAQRLERGWSQARLAAEAGLSKTTIGDLENGRYRPSDRTTGLLAAALRRGCDELTVAVEDVRLRRLAGPSFRLYLRRRRNPRRAALYERAAAVLDERVAAEGDRAAALAETLDRVFGDARPQVR